MNARPLDHRALLRSLSDDQRRTLTETRDAPGLVRLGAHLGAIGALGALIAAGAPGWPVLLLPQGVLIVFLFTLLHETSHRTPFRTGWLNDAAGWISGAAMAITPGWFQYFHLAHHRFTHDPARDPELETPKPETTRAYLRAISGLPFWRANIAVLARNAFGGEIGDYVPMRARPRVRREARILVGVYAALAGVSILSGSALLLWVWILPALIGQPFLRLYLMAEHARCPHVADMLENTRTTFTTALVRWIAWNMPYHAEHHAWPTVPFHRLPDFHRIARPHLRSTERGYTRFHRRFIRALGA